MDSAIKALAVYVVLWMFVRVSGRRTLAELSPFDFVLFLIIGGATQRALVGQDYSLINAFVVVATLIVTDVLVGYLERGFPMVGRIIRGGPTVLVAQGKMLTQRMRRARVTADDIMEHARLLHGLETVDQIKYAILEASGKISIIPQSKPRARPPRRRRQPKASG